MFRNEPLVERIRQIKSDHPFWGYRRMWAYLRYVDGLVINKKRVYRLMKEHNLMVRPNHKLKAKRLSGRPSRLKSCEQPWRNRQPGDL